MIEPPGDRTSEYTARARRFAALSGSFDPRLLRDVLGDVPPGATIAVAADLAEACDTRHGGTSRDGATGGAAGGGATALGPEAGRWLMRGTVRRREIEVLAATGELPAAIAWRRNLPLDEATEDLLDALSGSRGYDDRSVRAAIDRDPGRDVLTRIAVALDRAGSSAPAYAAVDAVRSALGRLDGRDRSSAMLARGFFGRVAETEKIAAWLARPILRPPVRALFISGLPGIGKSTLLDEAARRATIADPPWVLVRLDFDRAGLDVQDRVGLTMEITRQISVELGDEAATLRQARLSAAGVVVSPEAEVKGGRREHVPDVLAQALADAVRAARRPILVILDTLEVLRGRGETHPLRLFECLDELSDRGIAPLAVIAAGRGDALDSAADRIGDRIDLEGLDQPAADALLARLEVPTRSFAQVRELADGNPLVLRLAALAVRDAGPEALVRAKGKREVAAAYLYRFLLSRIADPTLRRLARPGLVVRRINPEVIAQVLAPQLKLARLQPAEAVRLFDTLATHHWLVEPDPTAPGWVRHRSDIRAVLLRLLYRDSGATAARIDRRAAKWFAGRSEPFAQVEAAYHQLQALRWGGDPPSLDPEVIQQFDKETIAELPAEAQDLVHVARGERTSQFRASVDGSAGPSPAELQAAGHELEAILERGDVIEAAHVHERSFARVTLDRQSPEAAIVRTFLWRAGRWRAATTVLRGRNAIRRPEDDLRERSPLVALALLEMWAEIRFADLVEAFRRDSGLVGFADDLRRRGFKGALGNGALGFALLRSGAAPSRASWSDIDPVAEAEAVWTDRAVQTAVPGYDRLVSASSRLAARVKPFAGPRVDEPPPQRPILPDASTPAGAARLLAGLTPYGSVAEAIRGADPGRVLRHLSSVDFDLAETGGLPPSGSANWSIAPAVSPDGSVESVASLGLLAEWLGAAAFVLRHPDLRLVAHSAERWRRTVAGDWEYATSGPDDAPPWRLRPDATIGDRVRQLQAAPDPIAASQEQLRLWWAAPARDAGRMEARFERRLGGALAAAHRAGRAGGTDAGSAADPGSSVERAAIELLGRAVPSAFVPALAVLVTTPRREGSRST